MTNITVTVEEKFVDGVSMGKRVIIGKRNQGAPYSEISLNNPEARELLEQLKEKLT